MMKQCFCEAICLLGLHCGQNGNQYNSCHAQIAKHNTSPRISAVYLGAVVQSVVRLTSSLVVKMLNVLVSTLSNSQVFLLKKM